MRNAFFPVSVTGGSLCTAVAVSLVTVSMAVAQPMILKRPTPALEAPVEAPAEMSPAPAADGAVDGPETVAPRPGDTRGIMVQSLGAVDVEAVGTIGAADGGFGTAMWQETGWDLVADLMPRLPEETASDTLRSLTSRLLLTRAVVPEGKPEDTSFVRLRVERLVAMGEVPGALALISAVPVNRRDAFTKIETDTLFLDGRSDDACKRVEGRVADAADSYWRQALAFCLARSGGHARAALIADLLRERGTDVPPLFYAALERLSGVDGAAPDLPNTPSGLVLAMALAAKFEIPAVRLRTAPPPMLRAVARSENADPAVRLDAAERALDSGAMSADEIVALYGAFGFSPEELSAPLTSAAANWGPRGRALLIRAAATQPVGLGKAEVLDRAWQLGREKGGIDMLQKASLPIVASIEPSPALAEFAAAAARILYLGGRFESAAQWVAIAGEGRTERDPGLWPFKALTAPVARPSVPSQDIVTGVSPDTVSNEVIQPGPMPDDVSGRPMRTVTPAGRRPVPSAPSGIADAPDLVAWAARMRGQDADEGARRAVMLLATLSALDQPVPVAAWHALLEAPLITLEPGLNQAWARSLEAAVSGRRVGETVLLVAAGLGATGERSLSSGETVSRAVSALRRVGLVADAQRLAVEAAVAAGL